MNIFEELENLYQLTEELIEKSYEQIKELKDYEKPEYLRLLCSLKYANEGLYGHDEEYPSYNTLQKDFYELITTSIQFQVYCNMIGLCNDKDLLYITTKIKNVYYNYFEEIGNVFDLLNECANEIVQLEECETELTERIREFLNKIEGVY